MTATRRILFFVIGWAFAALALSPWFSARAAEPQLEFNFPSGKGSMYLGQNICENKTVIALYGDDLPDLRAGFVKMVDGKTYPGCWYLSDGERVLFVDEDGDLWLPPIPGRWFHAPGAAQTYPRAPEKPAVKPSGTFMLDTIHYR